MLTCEHKKKIKYLEQYKYININIDRKFEEMERWREKLYSIASTISDMPRSGNAQDKISTGIAALEELEESVYKDVDKMFVLRLEIEKAIETVSQLHLKEILKCRYLDCKSFEEIAYKSGYSWRHTFRLHEQALDKIKL